MEEYNFFFKYFFANIFMFYKKRTFLENVTDYHFSEFNSSHKLLRQKQFDLSLRIYRHD